jgi:hypothetical protein
VSRSLDRTSTSTDAYRSFFGTIVLMASSAGIGSSSLLVVSVLFAARVSLAQTSLAPPTPAPLPAGAQPSPAATAGQPSSTPTPSPTPQPSPPAAATPPEPTSTFVSLQGGGLPESPRVARRVRVDERPSEREPEASTDRPVAFRADMKLPFAVSPILGGGGDAFTPFAPVPQLVLGIQVGRLGLGAGIGFTRLGTGGLGTGGDITQLLVAPDVTFDVFQSRDGKVAFYLLGAPIVGVVLVTNSSAQSDYGFQFAVGANYALHENFRIGLEVGPVGNFYGSAGAEGGLSEISVYTALVGTFAYPGGPAVATSN